MNMLWRRYCIAKLQQSAWLTLRSQCFDRCMPRATFHASDRTAVYCGEESLTGGHLVVRTVVLSNSSISHI